MRPKKSTCTILGAFALMVGCAGTDGTGSLCTADRDPSGAVCGDTPRISATEAVSAAVRERPELADKRLVRIYGYPNLDGLSETWSLRYWGEGDADLTELVVVANESGTRVNQTEAEALRPEGCDIDSAIELIDVAESLAWGWRALERHLGDSVPVAAPDDILFLQHHPCDSGLLALDGPDQITSSIRVQLHHTWYIRATPTEPLELFGRCGSASIDLCRETAETRIVGPMTPLSRQRPR